MTDKLSIDMKRGIFACLWFLWSIDTDRERHTQSSVLFGLVKPFFQVCTSNRIWLLNHIIGFSSLMTHLMLQSYRGKKKRQISCFAAARVYTLCKISSCTMSKALFTYIILATFFPLQTEQTGITSPFVTK